MDILPYQSLIRNITKYLCHAEVYMEQAQPAEQTALVETLGPMAILSFPTGAVWLTPLPYITVLPCHRGLG